MKGRCQNFKSVFGLFKYKYLRPAASAGLVGLTSKICQTFSFAPSNEQNLIEIPKRPCPPQSVLGVIRTSRTYNKMVKYTQNSMYR